jgi:hypothetical protein
MRSIVWAITVLAVLGFGKLAYAKPLLGFSNPILQDHFNQLTYFYSGKKNKVSPGMKSWIPQVKAFSRELIRLAQKPNAIQQVHAYAENAQGQTWKAAKDMFAVMGQDRVPMFAAGFNEGRNAALKRIQLADQVLDNQKALDLFQMGLYRMQGNKQKYQQAARDYHSVFKAQQVLRQAGMAYRNRGKSASSGGSGLVGSWMQLYAANVQAGVNAMSDMGRLWNSTTTKGGKPTDPAPARAEAKQAAPKKTRKRVTPNTPRSRTFGYLSMAAQDAANSVDWAVKSADLVKTTTFGVNPFASAVADATKQGAKNKAELIRQAAVVKEGGGLMGYAVATMTGNPRLKNVFATDIVEGRRARMTCEAVIAKGNEPRQQKPANLLNQIGENNRALMKVFWGPWVP